MLSKKIETAINEQINKEFYSAYLYLAMAAHFDSIALPGFASWMKVQAGEERGHGMKLYDYVYERGGKVELKAIALPPTSFGKPREIFAQVLEHERQVTASIDALYKLARAEGDSATELFLQWFVNEQVEEEKNASDLVDQLAMSGDQAFGLLFMDKHVLGSRKSD